ncbi:hypothetical protein OSB04_012357 [Centaurea solstitialis]|uniref:Reverse transcriptase domain-containing protein n=1 Tax=Centaurea solstitialis TaxID=347529 RepID=A0AA38TB89_9ASTR|nr:hypothetical protein OSB04_012357 [Centaurea solstitialis]
MSFTRTIPDDVRNSHPSYPGRKDKMTGTMSTAKQCAPCPSYPGRHGPTRVSPREPNGDLKDTRMTIQLADRSIKYPVGIAEDVPIQVDKFVFPADFVILDIKDEVKVPLILGRPFLNTAQALINVAE